jgi:hypothetical protein
MITANKQQVNQSSAEVLFTSIHSTLFFFLVVLGLKLGAFSLNHCTSPFGDGYF